MKTFLKQTKLLTCGKANGNKMLQQYSTCPPPPAAHPNTTEEGKHYFMNELG